jgi:hypothetical protein
MNFSSFRNKLNEEVVLRPYSVQALGRKRNVMLNTLQLDDNEFAGWVQDRLYRVAEQNKIPIGQLPIDYVVNGFQKWEDAFRNGDPVWESYKTQFTEYSKRFIDTARKMIQDKYERPGTSPTEQPMAPGMVKYEAADGR